MKPTTDGMIRKATALVQRGERGKAEALYREILRRFPGNRRAADALEALGAGQVADISQEEVQRLVAVLESGRFGEAIGQASALIARYPGAAVLYSVAGIAQAQLGQFEEALISFDKASRLMPGDAGIHRNLGNALLCLGRLEEAVTSFDRALEIDPAMVDVYIDRGNCLKDLGRFDEALVSFENGLKLKPDLAGAWYNRGHVLVELDQLGDIAERFGGPPQAIASYDTALRLDPSLKSVQALALFQRSTICDWGEAAKQVDLASLGIVGEAVGPFTLLALDDDPARQLTRARRWAQASFPAARPPLPKPSMRPDRLRIGYFSGDFQNHAMMFLAGRLFELHDRDRFELHAFSFGPDKQDKMRQRAAGAFDQFHEVRGNSDAAIADMARERGIDIAVDLSGYTRSARTGIFAHRAAPLQINYLGYPGTMGAAFMDYIIADPVVVPPGARRFYDEKVITLPHCYQATDDTRLISPRGFKRTELRLPEDGFVFCCFNANFKLSPAEFDVWMRLLRAVPGSVLWLIEGSKWSRANLRREAAARGSDPARLIFAPGMPNPDHLARHRAADLFLDTFGYTAHTTASDALWAGLPLVTRLGESFAARVGASLLEATGMGELVTHSLAEYEALALALAADPERLAAIRAKLAAGLPSAPLFSSQTFARDIERAYDLAFARRLAGLPTDHIDLGDLTR